MKNNWFTVKQLKPRIWGIGEFNHFEKVISYLIVGKRRALLFDTGLGIQSIEKVIRALTKIPILVINSHTHFDHIGGNKEFNRIKRIKSEGRISVQPFQFQIIHTPGHSPDSYCLFEKRFRYLFAGDTLYPGPIYLHLKESCVEDYILSIKKLIKLGKINRIFPGHNDFKSNLRVVKLINEKLKQAPTSKRIIRVGYKTSLLLK